MSSRIVWRVIASVVGAIALVATTVTAVDAMTFRDELHHGTVPAAGLERVVVLNHRGDVQVKASGEPEVDIQAITRGGLQLGTWDSRREGNTLYIEGGCALDFAISCSVDFEIWVPASVWVQVETAHGRMQIQGMSGPADLINSHGAILTYDLSGPIRAQLDHGYFGGGENLRAPQLDLRLNHSDAELEFIAAPSSLRVHADHSSARLTVPPAAYGVAEQVDHGQIIVDLPQDPASQLRAELSVDHGDIRLAPNAVPAG